MPCPGRTVNAWTRASRCPSKVSCEAAGGHRTGSIFWCAGSGVVATPAAAMASETETWERFLARLGSELGAATAAPPTAERHPRELRRCHLRRGPGGPLTEAVIDAPAVRLWGSQAPAGEGARTLGGGPTRSLHTRGSCRQPLRTRPATRQAPGPHLADVALPDPPPAASHLRAARHRPRFRVRRGRCRRARAVVGAAESRGGERRAGRPRPEDLCFRVPHDDRGRWWGSSAGSASAGSESSPDSTR